MEYKSRLKLWSVCEDQSMNQRVLFWLNAKRLLHVLFTFFTVNALRGDRSGFQALNGNVFFTGFTYSKRSVFNADQRFFYFFDQFVFTVSDAKFKTPLCFMRSPVRGIGKIFFWLCHTSNGAVRVGKQLINSVSQIVSQTDS